MTADGWPSRNIDVELQGPDPGWIGALFYHLRTLMVEKFFFVCVFFVFWLFCFCFVGVFLCFWGVFFVFRASARNIFRAFFFSKAYHTETGHFSSGWKASARTLVSIQAKEPGCVGSSHPHATAVLRRATCGDSGVSGSVRVGAPRPHSTPHPPRTTPIPIGSRRGGSPRSPSCPSYPGVSVLSGRAPTPRTRQSARSSASRSARRCRR